MRVTFTVAMFGLLAGGCAPRGGAGGTGLDGSTTDSTGEEPDLRIFEEEKGAWSLQRFALDGTNWVQVDQMARSNAFLLKFDEPGGSGVVAAASCRGGGSISVTKSTCRINFEGWECRCFSYIHEEANRKRTLP